MRASPLPPITSSIQTVDTGVQPGRYKVPDCPLVLVMAKHVKYEAKIKMIIFLYIFESYNIVLKTKLWFEGHQSKKIANFFSHNH